MAQQHQLQLETLKDDLAAYKLRVSELGIQLKNQEQETAWVNKENE